MYQNFPKRFFDVAVGLILTPFLFPFFLLVAILIKLDSKGPAFFVQKRVGKNGNYFNMFKFRTMSSCPESEKKEFEPGEKKRITKFGAILRKCKFDELPQIFNVLLGDMSLVGPRPEVKKYIDVYPERWKKILSIRPGITDPASVIFRNEEEILSASSDPETEYKEKIMPHKLALYEKYISDISFINDAKVIFATIFNVLLK